MPQERDEPVSVACCQENTGLEAGVMSLLNILLPIVLIVAVSTDTLRFYRGNKISGKRGQ